MSNEHDEIRAAVQPIIGVMVDEVIGNVMKDSSFEEDIANPLREFLGIPPPAEADDIKL
jgi:hypothetical protein